MVNLHPGQIVATVVMSRVSEYFGFFVFAISCALVFPNVFLPNYDAIVGTLFSFGIFSLAFIARPFAKLLFAPLEARVGRGAKITVAMFLLGGSSIFVAFIPGYADIGVIGVMLLSAARIGQGIGSGGVSEGLPIIMMMNAPENKKSWYAMVPQLGGPVGFFVAASIFYVLTNYLTPEEFIDWGWRFPFMVVLALQVVALFSRLRLIDTPEYKSAVEHLSLRGRPVIDVMKDDWRHVLLGTYLPLASFTLFHMVTVYPLGFVKLYTGLSVPDLLFLQAMGAVLAFTTCILSGFLADRYGRLRFLIVVTFLVGLLSFFIGTLQDNTSIFVLLGFGLLGLSFGQSGGVLPEQFKHESRFTGIGLSTDFGWLFGAAFAPLIAIGLTVWLGLEYAGYYLLSGAVATLIALYIAGKAAQRGN